jgi:DNA-binding MarR family transcriptional regulator
MDAPRRSRRRQSLRPELIRAEPYRRPRSLASIARTLVEHHLRRSQYIAGAVFEDPQWLMTLELFIAGEERREVSVSSLCFASGVPATTALRHIRALEARDVFTRLSYPKDRRISHIRLSESSRLQVVRYLHSISASDLLVEDGPPLLAAH